MEESSNKLKVVQKMISIIEKVTNIVGKAAESWLPEHSSLQVSKVVSMVVTPFPNTFF